MENLEAGLSSLNKNQVKLDKELFDINLKDIDDIDKDEEPDTTELDNLTEEEEFEEQQDEGDAEEVPDSATDTKSCPACGAGVGIGSSLCSVCGFTFSL